jgi:hypothetical protein
VRDPQHRLNETSVIAAARPGSVGLPRQCGSIFARCASVNTKRSIPGLNHDQARNGILNLIIETVAAGCTWTSSRHLRNGSTSVLNHHLTPGAVGTTLRNSVVANSALTTDSVEPTQELGPQERRIFDRLAATEPAEEWQRMGADLYLLTSLARLICRYESECD